MNKLTLLVFFSLLAFDSVGQRQYMVFFKDKAASTFSIDRPEEFLSLRSILRRKKQGIPIIEQDIPVSSKYVLSLKELGISTVYETKWMNGVLVEANSQQVEVIRRLEFVSGTEFVGLRSTSPTLRGEIPREPDNPMNDLAFPQTNLLGIPDMHREGIEGQGLLIGLFDDGFQNISTIAYFDHLFREDKILYTYDYVRGKESVENGFHHGLRSISTVAALGPDYKGTSPGASFILAVTEYPPSEYRVEEYNWLFAAEEADSAGVDIISTSLGYSNGFSLSSMDYTPEQMDGHSAVITRAANIAASKGIFLVSSAGNKGNSPWQIITAPSDSEQVLSVGATDLSGQIAGFSSIGPNSSGNRKPDVVAVGSLSSVISVSGRPLYQSGTSFSAPQVTGLAAGLWQVLPSLTNFELLDLIRRSGDRFKNADNMFGYGYPNWNKAMTTLRENVDEEMPKFTVFPNPLKEDIISLSISTEKILQNFDIQMVMPDGRVVKDLSKRVFGTVPLLQIDLSDLPKGMYLLRLSNSKGSESQRILKY